MEKGNYERFDLIFLRARDGNLMLNTCTIIISLSGALKMELFQDMFFWFSSEVL